PLPLPPAPALLEPLPLAPALLEPLPPAPALLLPLPPAPALLLPLPPAPALLLPLPPAPAPPLWSCMTRLWPIRCNIPALPALPDVETAPLGLAVCTDALPAKLGTPKK